MLVAKRSRPMCAVQNSLLKTECDSIVIGDWPVYGASSIFTGTDGVNSVITGKIGGNSESFP